MNEIDKHFPESPCPFCGIAEAFPYRPSTSLATSSTSSSPSSLTSSELLSCIPSNDNADPSKTDPSSFIVLAAENVIAFLDILPMTGGHLLVATRGHRRTVGQMGGREGADVGFWLPVLARMVSRVTGVSDYNIVQNNGARAAQVVPHVHFHIIPRPETLPELKSKSWTMFGRGMREELDDEEGEELAEEMRRVLREEVMKMEKGTGRGKL
ncbi:HIT-like protein [Delitschia confertaspora ATCC 74209]|uniref:HIT-like protein n=1 Tax=Delitschia confertaspora ATCC 74209 TaxID=1513339 RepID=A0A9P4JQU3_9PLEO|nr:HIT-like protein [Delitschia confertaspora ATCC 74209]